MKLILILAVLLIASIAEAVFTASPAGDKETLVLVDDLSTEQTHSIFVAKLKGNPVPVIYHGLDELIPYKQNVVTS